MRGDLITNSARYLHYVEGMHPDVRLLDRGVADVSVDVETQVQRKMPDVVLPAPARSDAAGFVPRCGR